MAKKVIITTAQIDSIRQLSNDVEAMIGCGDPDGAEKNWIKYLKNIDNFLKKNNIKR